MHLGTRYYRRRRAAINLVWHGIFRCVAYAQSARRKKLDDRGEKCTFIGYNEDSKACKLYNPVVVFGEEAWKLNE